MDRRTFVKALTSVGAVASALAHTPEGQAEIIVGSLSNQNWHRQIRRLRLEGSARLDYMIKKTAAIGKEFGFNPMGMDLSIASLPSTEKVFLDELKARLTENNLWPVTGVGGVAVSYDEEVRLAALDAGRRNLEIAVRFGARTCTFSPQMNGRVTRAARVRLATDSLKELGKSARSLGLRLCQENFDYFSSEDLMRISEGTGLDNVGILNDTGNWLILNEDPVSATRRCLPRTFHAHVRDSVLEDGV